MAQKTAQKSAAVPGWLLLVVFAMLGVAGWWWLSSRGESSSPETRVWNPRGAQVSALHLIRVPEARTFLAPMGTESGGFTYDAQPFGENAHLGEDWNGIGGGDSDFGEPLYAVGHGLVVYSGTPSPGWGQVLILQHRHQGEWLQSLYGHLSRVDVEVGEVVWRGQPIGAVGDASGKYLSHLHFELRRGISLWPGPGYGKRANRLEPSHFLDRKAPPSRELYPLWQWFQEAGR